MERYNEYDKLFCISENNLSEEKTKHFEGVMTQGSGYMHIRASLEEGIYAAPQNEEYMRMPANVTIEKPRHPRSKFGTYIPGVTGNHPLLNNEGVNLPYPFLVKVSIDGEWLDIDESNIEEHTRCLDMRDGVLYRTFRWKAVSGAVVRAQYKRFISRANPNIVWWQGEYTADRDCEIAIVSYICSDVKTNGYKHFDVKSGNTDFCSLITDTDVKVNITSKIMPEAGIYTLTKDVPFIVNKVCCYNTSRDNENSLIKYKTVDEYIEDNGFDMDKEYFENKKVWQDLWKHSQIEIKGDDTAQYAVNFSTYHLLRAVDSYDSRVAICAKGFAGEAYFGHYFWDTEVYLLPFYLYTNPELSKSLVEFRIKTLEGAKRNAQKLGYRGARYPWESSLSGDEQCPNWQYADNEIHITADVVFGMWHYYTNTGDIEFLKEAVEVFCETAKYWCDRVYTKKDGSVHLNGVMGPDEYICFCNDNLYTNVMVKKSLEITLKSLEILRDNGIDCNISEEYIARFKYIIDNIAILKTDDGIYLQCKDFDDFEDIDFDTEWQDKSVMFGKLFSQEKNYRSKALKQADVLMLPYMFDEFMTDEELRKNFDLYFPITTHDSSLSNIIHSILLSKLGDNEKAYELFIKSIGIDLDENIGGAAEGIHIANCGGIWQSIIFGFAGMSHSYDSDMPKFNAKLPAHWESVKFPFCFKNERYTAMITNNETKIIKDDAKAIKEKIDDGRIKGIIFDLDGVVVSTDMCHYEAWKMLADEEGIYFDFEINERLRGVSRMESLEIVLERADKSYTDEEKLEMAERKNNYYKEKIMQITPDAVLDGAAEFIEYAKSKDVKVAIGSSSKNTKLILAQVGMSDTFDEIADGNDIKNSKPDPEVFVLAAEKLGIPSDGCLVVEDADAGVEAGLGAGSEVLAVGSAKANKNATYRLSALSDFIYV